MDENNSNDVNEQAPEVTAPAQPQENATGNTEPPADVPKKSLRRLLTSPAGIAIILIIIALIAGGLLWALSSSDDNEDTAQNETQQQEVVTTLGAAIANVEGDVETSTDGSTWTAAEAGQSLANLDYVRTLADSRAIVLFDDGSVTRLDSNTELYLSSLQPESLEVTLVDGQTYNRVVESDSMTFTVVTANERFEALGTAYKTATTGDTDTLEVYQSSVKVTSTDEEVSEGNKYATDTQKQEALDLEDLAADEFAQWNKERDSESAEFKDKLGVLDTEKPEQTDATDQPQNTTTAANPSINLSASPSDKGVALSWSLTNASSANGFKIVRAADTQSPLYGTHEAQYVGADSRAHTWWDDNGGTHYYRVCIYRDNGTCDTYSNAVQVTSPKVEKEPVVSGGINLSISGNTISWSLAGGSAPHGFKVTLSEAPNPVYPANSIQYVGADTLSATLPDKATGTYYVRVCKYTNGTQTEGCVNYSNEVEYVVE